MKRAKNAQKTKKSNKWSTVALLLMFIVGLSVMLYPAISTYWNSRTQSKAIIDYDKMLENIPKEDFTKLFQEAEDYNEKLSMLNFPFLEYNKIDNYLKILDVNGTGMIGYITINKIALQLPVYHTTSKDVLSIAVGHLEGSSLPVGGKTTHSVVSAHRGLPTATLFSNLDHLEIGDVFVFTVLDRKISYQVDSIKTVKPGDTSDLTIEQNKDYCTLLTCTPYGVNTHRLLVRGRRVATVEEKTIQVTSDAQKIDVLIVTPIVALPILIILMIYVLFKPVKKIDAGDDFE